MIDANGQRDMFAENPGVLPARPVSHVPSPDHVRQRMRNMLNEVRGFRDQLPWTAQELYVAKLIFHNAGEWLPSDEREALRAAYLAELARLNVPA